MVVLYEGGGMVSWERGLGGAGLGERVGEEEKRNLGGAYAVLA